MSAASHFWSLADLSGPSGVLLLILAVLAACGVAVIVHLLSPAGRRTLLAALGAAVTIAALTAVVSGLAVLAVAVIR